MKCLYSHMRACVLVGGGEGMPRKVVTELQCVTTIDHEVPSQEYGVEDWETPNACNTSLQDAPQKVCTTGLLLIVSLKD